MKTILAALSVLICASQTIASDWPQFRGPNGDGVAQVENVPAEFGENKNLRWKTELPGRGWSSPVYDGEAFWMTTAEEIFPDEEERVRRLKAEGVEERQFKQKQVASSIDLSLLKVDAETGELLQRISLRSISEPQAIHQLNSFASPTPVVSNDLVIAHFGTFGTYAISRASGEVAWTVTIPLEHSVGPGSSPFVEDGLLFLICDGTDRQFVTALDATTGETVWATDRPEMRAPKGDQKKAYNTPILIEDRSGRKQLICMGSQWLVSYDPKSGDEIWKLDHGDGFSVVPRPVFSKKHQLVYISTGFGKPVLLAVRVDGKGDVTNQNKIAWREEKRIPAKPSPLLVGDELYVLADGGIATCFDAGTGNVHWTERIEGNYSASPLFADGKIYVASQEGSATVIEPSKTFTVLSENQLPGSIMASPLALDGSLVVRSDSSIYRFSE